MKNYAMFQEKKIFWQKFTVFILNASFELFFGLWLHILSMKLSNEKNEIKTRKTNCCLIIFLFPS